MPDFTGLNESYYTRLVYAMAAGNLPDFRNDDPRDVIAGFAGLAEALRSGDMQFLDRLTRDLEPITQGRLMAVPGPVVPSAPQASVFAVIHTERSPHFGLTQLILVTGTFPPLAHMGEPYMAGQGH